MGLILPQEITIKWSATGRQHYIDLGYKYTKTGELFTVNVLDLSKGSSNEVLVKCDYCNNKIKMPWRQYLKLQGDTYCCTECLKHKKKTRDENGNLIFIEIPYRNKEWLHSEYIIKGRMAADIANECGINLRTLREWITIFNLNNKYQEKTKDLTKDVLEELYCNQHKTSEEIGEIYEVSGNTIIDLVRSYGLKVPNRSELMKIYFYKKGGLVNSRKINSNIENRIRSSCRQRGISIADFDGFSTSEQHMQRNNTYYKEWKNNVFKRDNYTCQCCGKRGGNLNAHHLYNFSQYKELRYDVKNGITFCEKCHLITYPNSFHSIYGERNNTPQQVFEYVKTFKKVVV